MKGRGLVNNKTEVAVFSANRVKDLGWVEGIRRRKYQHLVNRWSTNGRKAISSTGWVASMSIAVTSSCALPQRDFATGSLTEIASQSATD
jgi:hypothetical protein